MSHKSFSVFAMILVGSIAAHASKDIIYCSGPSAQQHIEAIVSQSNEGSRNVLSMLVLSSVGDGGMPQVVSAGIAAVTQSKGEITLKTQSAELVMNQARMNVPMADQMSPNVSYNGLLVLANSYKSTVQMNCLKTGSL